MKRSRELPIIGSYEQKRPKFNKTKKSPLILNILGRNHYIRDRKYWHKAFHKSKYKLLTNDKQANFD